MYLATLKIFQGHSSCFLVVLFVPPVSHLFSPSLVGFPFSCFLCEFSVCALKKTVWKCVLVSYFSLLFLVPPCNVISEFLQPATQRLTFTSKTPWTTEPPRPLNAQLRSSSPGLLPARLPASDKLLTCQSIIQPPFPYTRLPPPGLCSSRLNSTTVTCNKHCLQRLRLERQIFMDSYELLTLK